MDRIEQLYPHYLSSTGVSTDTRTLKPGMVFFALRGPNFNANKLANQALEQGALLAVIDDKQYATDRTFLVSDVLTTLQQLATHHRKQLTLPVLGINGTNGKTTTKELVNAVLETRYKTFATRGNLNNHIGVPLTLLSTPEDTEMLVVELGANAVGEIAALCSIAQPTHGLTTNIGKAHLEGFGGLEGAIRGESEQYDYLIKNNKPAFLHSQDPILANMAKRFPEKPITYPAPGDFLHAELLSSQPFIVYRTEEEHEITTQLPGRYNFVNIAAALCVGKYFGVNMNEAHRAVAAYAPRNNRSEIVEKEGVTIIMDAYNANPDSMKVAVENLQEMQNTHRVAILGDMYELGSSTEEEHRGTGRLLRQAGIETVYLCGEYMQHAARELPEARYFASKQELADFLDTQQFSNTTLLLKGSRGMALETLLDHINADK